VDFFAHQDRARLRSARLLVLFLLALAVIIVLVNAGALLGWRLLFSGMEPPRHFVPTNVFVVLLVVGGSAWLERMRLGGSGHALAERLGAQALDDADPLHRRFRDVAEEVAVGAGVPVPGLYVLDDASINALAAGERPTVAVVMVTRGALERLDRAQLQGVVAHEYAHILGGDAVLNVRLTSALYGLCALRMFGGHLLGWAFSRERGSALRLLSPLAAVAGVIVSAFGIVGVGVAQLLRAGISRQCEFLADAVAVQLTRDRNGLGSALRRVAAEQAIAARTAAPDHRQGYTALVSHFMLVQPSDAGHWFDSHPSLAERIRRLYGRVPAESRRRFRFGLPARVRNGAGARSAASALVRPRREAESHTEALRWVETMAIAPDDRPAAVPLSATPASALIERLRAPELGRADAARWLLALVTGRVGEPEPDARVAAALRWLLSPSGGSLRVPVLELMLARFRRWSLAHRRALLDRCRRAIESDGRLESAEWVHYTLARHRLLPRSSPPAADGTAGTRRGADARRAHSRALAALFAMAAAIGEASARTTRDTLAEAAVLLRVPAPASTPDELDTGELARALDVLESLPPLDKPLLLRMLARMARVPGDPDFNAFVRAVAAAIDCPLPRYTIGLGVAG